MPDDTATTASLDATLAELERRAAAFEVATKRLTNPVDRRPVRVHAGPVEVREPAKLPPENTAATMASAALGGLVPRHRSDPLEPIPFTSALDRPSVPVLSATTPDAGPAPVAASPWWLRPQFLLPGLAILVLGGLLLLLSRPLATYGGGAVVARTTLLSAPQTGAVSQIAVQVSDHVEKGALLLMVDGTPLTAPAAGQVSRLLTADGARVAAREPLLELADPAAMRIVIPLPSIDAVAEGETVLVRLHGERRTEVGQVEAVAAAAPGTPRPRATVILMQGAEPPKLGQGAQITLIENVHPLRLLAHRIRESLR